MVTKQPAEKRGAVLSDPALCEVDQEHLAFVHDAPDVQVLLGGREDAVEQRVGEKCADFVLNGGDAVGAVAEREALEFLLQKCAHGLVFQTFVAIDFPEIWCPR